MMEQSGAQHTGVIARIIFSVIILLGAGWLFVNRQQVIDYFSILTYHPSAQIQSIVTQTSMTNEGKHYFYSGTPVLQGRTAFNSSCSDVMSEQTAVLGCYTGPNIYIFNVKNSQLDGIKEVTAAHEMLHAAYDRLSASEKQRVNGLLNDQAKVIKSDTIKQLLKEYAKSEPGQRLNELHSIIGTQVADLSQPLEQYYSQYFKDRHKVVKLYDQYESVFASLKNRQDQIVKQLKSLSAQIDADKSQYSKDVEALKKDLDDFNADATSGHMSSSEYDQRKAALVARQNELKARANQINDEIDTYNSKRQELLAINSKALELNQSIDSSLKPVQGINQ